MEILGVSLASLVAVAGFIAIVHALPSRPTLFILAIIDFICGALILSIEPSTLVSVMIYEVPYNFVYYLGIVIVLKGAYSLFFSFR